MTEKTENYVDRFCTWCRHLGSHVEADHPLPKTHPDYDAFYDASDDELAGMVSDSLGGAR